MSAFGTKRTFRGSVPMSAFEGKADIEAGSVKRRDHGPRQRANAALRAHSWRCSLVELSARA